MPLGRGIVEVFEAIPDRIEVSGHGPTWRVTAGSFETAVAYAEEAWDAPTVIARADRNRWWPRVTLTFTTDPARAALAPARDSFAKPPTPPAPAAPAAVPVPARTEAPARATPPVRDDDHVLPSLEAIFAYQEERRMARRFPEQRPPTA